MWLTIYKASNEEQRLPLPGDSIILNPIYTETRAITIHAPVERVWPWLAQMGSGRAGWYAFDRIDNGGHSSAKSILPEYQHIAPGDILPALPGLKDVFLVTAVDPPRRLLLTVPDATCGSRVSWEFWLQPLDQGRTRLIVRGFISPHWLEAVAQQEPAAHHQIFIERVYGWLAHIPRPLMIAMAAFGHGIMETRQLHGLKLRAEARLR